MLKPQESLTVEIGQVHTFANEREELTVIRIETKPAAGVVRAFQLAYGVANDGGAASDVLPKNPLVVRASWGFPPQVPLAVQKVVSHSPHLLRRQLEWK
ncbi:MAG TPA: hypothetical protein VMR02_20670 [Terracidiphilus sp.]|nr:hypothetical protein [Terracidiphilus sp.]